MPTPRKSQANPHKLAKVVSQFIDFLAKYFPDDPIDFHIFQRTFDFSGVSPEIFAQGCQHFAETLGSFKLVTNPDKPGGCELLPRFPSFVSFLFAGFEPFIEGLKQYYNNNNSNNDNNNNSNNNDDYEENDCGGNDGGSSESADAGVVSDEECRKEDPPVERPTPAKAEEKVAKLPIEVIELLQKIGVGLPYPRWLWKLLHSKPVEQILRNLTAVYGYKTRKRGLTSTLGAVRASIDKDWQPEENSTAVSPTGFLEWFEKMRAAGKVLASTQTPDGILVYSPEGECLGRWPEVASQL